LVPTEGYQRRLRKCKEVIYKCQYAYKFGGWSFQAEIGL